MVEYKYRAYTTSGDIEEGTVDAQTAIDAANRLSARGLVPFETLEGKQASSVSSKAWLVGINGPTLQDYSDVITQLATLLEADLPIDRALQVVCSQRHRRQIKDILQGVQQDVRGGQSLSGSLSIRAPSLPLVVPSLIRGGELRGKIADALKQSSDYLQRRQATSQKIASALTYPIILAVTAMISIAVIILALVPSLMPLFEASKANPPFALRLANSFAIFLSENWQIVVGAIALCLISLLVLSRNETYRFQMDRLALRLPYWGQMNQASNIIRFARTTGTALTSGIGIIEALTVGSKVCGNRVITRAITEAVEKIRGGDTMSEALSGGNAFPKVVKEFVAVGEQTSRLGEMLIHLADFHEKELQRSIDRGIALLTPILTIVIGLIVGGLILSVMQAIFSVNRLVL